MVFRNGKADKKEGIQVILAWAVLAYNWGILFSYRVDVYIGRTRRSRCTIWCVLLYGNFSSVMWNSKIIINGQGIQNIHAQHIDIDQYYHCRSTFFFILPFEFELYDIKYLEFIISPDSDDKIVLGGFSFLLSNWVYAENIFYSIWQRNKEKKKKKKSSKFHSKQSLKFIHVWHFRPSIQWVFELEHL